MSGSGSRPIQTLRKQFGIFSFASPFFGWIVQRRAKIVADLLMINKFVWGTVLCAAVLAGVMLTSQICQAQKQKVLTGQGAAGDWTTDVPGVRRRITVSDMPKPYESKSVQNGPKLVPRPSGALPIV